MIVPTIGRVVHFIPKKEKYDFGFCFLAGRPHAAMITAVHGDRCVNIVAFDVNGKSYGFTSVNLVQPSDAPDTVQGDYCCWMPFQVGQSQAVKEAQKEVAPNGP